MPIRLKDIAKDLGVSVVTVSKVVRGRGDIGEKTRNRVLKRMRELNYRPNMMARGLASGRTFTVGLVVPDLVQPYFAELAQHIGGVLRAANRALILASSEDDPNIERDQIQALLARGIDVLLLASCQTRVKHLEEIEEQRTPYILLDRNFPQLSANFVGVDDFRAGELATEHLISLGKKRIAHIGGKHIHPSLERMRGYRSALASHGLSMPEGYVKERERLEMQGDKAGHHCMRELLRMKDRPDAVFCYNDASAVGAMHAALEAGLRIPEDVAFVGCGNVGYSQYLRCPLTSIDQSIPEQGRVAGALALGLDGATEQSPRTVLLKPRLIIRESTVRGAESGRAASPPVKPAGTGHNAPKRAAQARRHASAAVSRFSL
ncbi:MAG: LacI family DNA-binding transcriptional regulator [Acidobacteriota bacterium]